MKYKFKHPVVEVTRVTQEGLPPVNGVQPHVGDYILVDQFGLRRVLSVDDVLSKMYPADPAIRDPLTTQLLLLAHSIIDLRTMVDDDNAETLLDEAIETAHKMYKLLAQ